MSSLLLRWWYAAVIHAHLFVIAVPTFSVDEVLRYAGYRSFWPGVYLGAGFIMWSNWVWDKHRQYVKEAR